MEENIDPELPLVPLSSVESPTSLTSPESEVSPSLVVPVAQLSPGTTPPAPEPTSENQNNSSPAPPSTKKKEYHPHIIDLESEIEDDDDDSSILESPMESEVGDSSESDASGSDSDSEDEYSNETLSSTIIREIEQGIYTCLVCTGEVDQYSKVWSCQHCYRVYDLDCIKDWAQRGSSTNKQDKTWRCPSCNVSHKKIPSRFTCWCGRILNPTSNSLIPFSCGNSCSYKHKSCIHTCSSICHPGLHPICGAMGPLMKCNCGKEERQLPCLITPYSDGWRCEEPCNVPVCDTHKCKKGCHLGFCGLCQENIVIKCYCGKHELLMKCSDKALKKCEQDGEVWIGGGLCDEKSTVYYDCNIHFEKLSCQPPAAVLPCKLSPTQITTCYCGKTHVNASGRTKCTDPVPECESKCDKPLPCGCQCLLKCHAGECVCYTIKDITCSCGHESYSVPCRYIQNGYKPTCKHKCSAMLNCRKHYHREVCCPDEQVALAREREKKKAIRNNTRNNFHDEIMSIEAVHICTRSCNRLKSCGQHYCEALCHPGPCGVCLESSNDDLVCNCGKTVIEAPVRCGTKLVCLEQCKRPKECGHRLEVHKCHDSSVSCPKCTATVKKECNCGLKTIPGVLCSQENISCDTVCTVSKSCGHPCLRPCSGKCTKENIHESSTLCRSPCNKVRKTCPHMCKLKCHSNKPGSSKNCDVTRCTDIVTVKCECGRIITKVACGSTVEVASRIGTVLECDEECSKLKRDQELKAAFNLSEEQPSSEYPDLILNTFERQRNWCCKIENLMRAFIEDYNLQLENEVESPKRTYHFPAMSAPQREFILDLASCYNLYSESQDEEPKKSIFIVITRISSLPKITIGEALDRRNDLIEEANKAAELTRQELEKAFFNALIIQDVFFGVIKDELEHELNSYIEKSNIQEPVFLWIKDSTFIFYSKVTYQSMTEKDEDDLYLLMKTFRKVLREKSLAFDCKLCRIDEEATYVLKVDRKSPEPQESTTEVSEKTSNNAFDLLSEEEAFEATA